MPTLPTDVSGFFSNVPFYKLTALPTDDLPLPKTVDEQCGQHRLWYFEEIWPPSAVGNAVNLSNGTLKEL